MSNQWLKTMHQRLQGIPRSARELNYSLQLLSVMRGFGWHRSLRTGHPIDRNGSSIPWYTYPQLEWLRPRVKQTDTIFEFGTGYSTVWWGRHAKEVIAVEHNSRWLDEVQKMTSSNVTLLLRTTSRTENTVGGESPYCDALREYPPNSFDIIVIDGMERVRCAYGAPSRLRDGGMIVFDNSDRLEYKPGIDYLHKLGFGRMDFYGFVPQVGTCNCTSIFSMFGTRWTSENVPLVSQGW